MRGLWNAGRIVTVALCAAIFTAAASAAPKMPISFNTSFSRSEREMLSTGKTESFSSMDNNISFNGGLPGTSMTSQKMNMSFSQVNSKSGGSTTTGSNFGMFFAFTGRHYSISNNFTLVENTSSGGQEPTKNKGMSMNASVNWPAMPPITASFASFDSGGQTTESGQFAMSHRIGDTSFNFNSMETTSASLSSPAQGSSSRSLGASRRLLSTKHLTIGSNMNFSRQKAESAGLTLSQSKNDTVALSIYDSHVKAVPLNLNINFQKGKQTSAAASSGQSSRNVNAFTSFVFPGGLNTSVSYNLSSQKISGSDGVAKSKVFSVGVSKKILEAANVNYSYSATKSGSPGSSGSVSRSSVGSIMIPFFNSTIVTVQKGTSYTGSAAVSSTSSFTSLQVSSTMRGGVVSTYQYGMSKAGGKSVSEAMSLRMPVGRDMSMSINTSKRKSSAGTDESMGIMASIAVTEALSLSTTWSIQESMGNEMGRLWSVGVTSLLPSRTTLNLSLSTQQTPELKNISTTLSFNMIF